MSVFTEAMTALETELAATGIRVVTDPATFSPPCVVLEAPTITNVTQGDAWTMTVPVALVGNQPANRATLDYLLEHVGDVLDACKTRQGDPGIYSPNGQQNFPCYRTTATITMRSI
jgi:hypothetical protein